MVRPISGIIAGLVSRIAKGNVLLRSIMQ